MRQSHAQRGVPMQHQNQRRESPRECPRQPGRDHAEKRASLSEIGRGQSFNRRAEFGQRRIDRFRVLGLRLNQNVNIFRSAAAREAIRRKLPQPGI